jgi:hypothetical protein
MIFFVIYSVNNFTSLHGCHQCFSHLKSSFFHYPDILYLANENAGVFDGHNMKISQLIQKLKWG